MTEKVTHEPYTLRGGRVLDPATRRDEALDVHVENGRITALASPGTKPVTGVAVDVEELVIVPGLIDIHVHLREPGFEYKETVATGTRAAVKGGFTTVFAMSNTRPVIDRPERVESLLEIVRHDAACRVLPIGAVTFDHGREGMTDFAALRQAGCVAVTDDAFPINDQPLQERILRQALQVGTRVIVHPELQHPSDGDESADRAMTEAWSLAGWTAAARAAASSCGDFVALMGTLHFAHVSTASFLEAFASLTQEPARTTLETCPHYWTLTGDAVKQSGTNAKMNPPLRSPEDVTAVRQALSSGEIAIIATDHAPHSVEEKAQSYPDAPNGIVGLETSLGLVLTELVDTGVLSLSDAIAKMTCNPARAFGLQDAGQLRVGGPADITLIDLNEEWTVEPSQFLSKGRNTPFTGRRLKGRAWGTIVGGQFVMKEGRLVG